MIRLLQAELTRFLSRKIVWIGFGLVFLALAGMIALLGLQTRQPSPSDLAQAEQNYASSHSDWEANHEQYEADCRASNPPNPDENCPYPEPQRGDFLFQLTFADVGPLVALTGVGFLGLTTAIVASSLIGADFSSGSMANWLSFIPVRWRVYVSKTLVSVVAPTVISAAVLAAAVGAMGLIVTIQQGSAAVTGWSQVWGSYGRGIVVIAFGGLLGAAIAFLTRRTIAAVGIVLGYLILKLLLSGIFGMTRWFSASAPWWPENNALAVLQADYEYQVVQLTLTPEGTSVDYVARTLPWEQGLVYLLVAAAVVTVAGLVTFTRRDVT